MSFLNARPLIEGLDAEPDVALRFAVPSALPGMLLRDEVDVALVPVIDLARRADQWSLVSNACIGSDGETLTVRIFSRVPIERITTLAVDSDSHTSVILAQVIWRQWHGRALQLIPLNELASPADAEAVLLIGDKVVTTTLPEHSHQLDLGGEWKQRTGLPFVFAAWAGAPRNDGDRIAGLLNAARDRGVARAAEIAEAYAPKISWPVHLAKAYVTRHLIYTITPDARAGMEQFFEMAREAGLVSTTAEMAS
mgnify:CR=1 FL=1